MLLLAAELVQGLASLQGSLYALRQAVVKLGAQRRHPAHLLVSACCLWHACICPLIQLPA